MIETPSSPVRGVMWMILTGLLFVGVTALVKVLGTRMPASQAAFLRYFLGLVFLLPMLGTLRNLRLDRGTWGLIGARGVLHTAGVALWFYAMARIPIADVTAMNYLAPIYVTIGAALFLGERLAARRVIAIVVALGGSARAWWWRCCRSPSRSVLPPWPSPSGCRRRHGKWRSCSRSPVWPRPGITP
jgi:drug/metabolite transporter (DMT)-like permease